MDLLTWQICNEDKREGRQLSNTSVNCISAFIYAEEGLVGDA